MNWQISILLVLVFGAGVFLGNMFGTKENKVKINLDFETFLLYIARIMFFACFILFAISLITYKQFEVTAWYAWVSAWATCGIATITRIWHDFV